MVLHPDERVTKQGGRIRTGVRIVGRLGRNLAMVPRQELTEVDVIAPGSNSSAPGQPLPDLPRPSQWHPGNRRASTDQQSVLRACAANGSGKNHKR